MSNDADESPQSSTLVEGQIFMGRYQILSILGRGGVGVVYKARHMHMDKFVAIKTLLNTVVTADAESFQRFEREARTASNLDHVNIIRIFDFGKTESGLVFLVMEYLGDRTLENLLIDKTRLDIDQFFSIASQICDGLQNAHKHNVIHRDIKPSNIMLVKVDGNEECVKIVDFGLAKLSTQESAQNLTQTGTIIGTPLFMSPEQCRGLALDHRSDIYSLGCVFYLALTGRVPIQGATALDTLFQHTMLRPKSFAEVGVGSLFPPRLEEVIFKALEKEPDMRHQSMLEFRTEIQKAVFEPGFRAAKTPANQNVPSMHQAQIVTAEDVGSPRYADLVDSTHTVVSINKSPESLRQLRASSPSIRQPAEILPEKTSGINKPAIIASAIAVVAVGVTATVLLTKSSPAPPLVVPVAETKQIAAVPTVKATSAAKAAVIEPKSEKAIKPHPAKTEKSEKPQRKAAVVPNKPPAMAKLPPPENSALPFKEPPGSVDFEQLSVLLNEGKVAAAQKDWPTAQRAYDSIVRLQTKMFGAHNYRLFPTLSTLLHCQMMQNKVSETRPFLMLALDIFKRDQTAVLNDVSAKALPGHIWRNMAGVCRANGTPTHDLALLKWSADFFELTRKAWKGPRDGAEYAHMCEDYSRVLEDCGDRNKANQIRTEINEPPLANTQAYNAKPDPASGAVPRKSKPHDAVQHNGRMVIHNYHY